MGIVDIPSAAPMPLVFAGEGPQLLVGPINRLVDFHMIAALHVFPKFLKESRILRAEGVNNTLLWTYRRIIILAGILLIPVLRSAVIFREEFGNWTNAKHNSPEDGFSVILRGLSVPKR